MDNDFNTSEVLARMHALMHETYKAGDPIALVTAAAAIRNFGSDVFGVVFDQNTESNALKPEIEKAIAGGGHDTKNFKGSSAAYNKLPSCCKYRDQACETGKK